MRKENSEKVYFHGDDSILRVYFGLGELCDVKNQNLLCKTGIYVKFSRPAQTSRSSLKPECALQSRLNCSAARMPRPELQVSGAAKFNVNAHFAQENFKLNKNNI